MGLSFQLGNTAFTTLSSAQGAYALALIVKPADCDILTYHIKGVKGSYTVGSADNFKEQEIVARVCYVDTLQAVYNLFTADKEDWEGTPITIQEPGGISYTRCFLQPGGGIIKGPMAIGRGANLVRMDCEFTFKCYGGRQ